MANGWGWRRAGIGSALLGMVLVITGCSGGDDNPASPTATPPPATTPAPISTVAVEPVELGSIVWTTSMDATGAPDEDLEVISFDAPAIIAALETGPLPAGTVLTGRWTMNGVDVPGGTVTVSADEARKAGWVSFELTLTEGSTWPPGVLELTVSTQSGEQTSRSVQIRVN